MISILYEDNHLLVVEKPVNVPTQADSSGDPDLLTLLKEGVKQRHGKPGNVFLGLVQRLDRPAGGVMVFARTSKAASRLSEQLRAGGFRKIYLAIVHGTPGKVSDRLEHDLIKNTQTNEVRVAAPGERDSKHAVLEYETLESSGKLSLLSIRLHTGRSHQIRVQCATIGHPLYGDQKYGADRNQAGMQLALWSHQLAFRHPTRDEEVAFQSSPPRSEPWTQFRAGSSSS